MKQLEENSFSVSQYLAAALFTKFFPAWCFPLRCHEICIEEDLPTSENKIVWSCKLSYLIPSRSDQPVASFVRAKLGYMVRYKALAAHIR